MAKKTSITLQITGPDGAVSESTSELESVIVGSGAGAAVKITDPRVSNLHFMLKVEKSGVVTAIDLGSEHGTMFKDANVTNNHPLLTGKIVLAHLKEMMDYYERLEVAELEGDLLKATLAKDAVKIRKYFKRLADARRNLSTAESAQLG